MTSTEQNLCEALKKALPYVERVAATAPTEPARMQRQREAARTAREIRETLASICMEAAA